jgi:hypothetical protein
MAMDFLANNPAALGGIIMSVALGSWFLGRWQGGFAVFEDGRGPAGQDASPAGALPAALQPGPGFDAVRAQRGAALAVTDSLGELHAEISAYRRAERVLAGSDPHGLDPCPPGEVARSACANPKVSDQRCNFAEPVCEDCTCSTRCSLADLSAQLPVRPVPLLQSSRPDPDLTRV